MSGDSAISSNRKTIRDMFFVEHDREPLSDCGEDSAWLAGCEAGAASLTGRLTQAEELLQDCRGALENSGWDHHLELAKRIATLSGDSQSSQKEPQQYDTDYTLAELAALCRQKDRHIARLESPVETTESPEQRRAAIETNALADAHRMYEAEHGEPFPGNGRTDGE